MKAIGLGCGLMIGMLAFASQARGAVYTDAATNYPGGSWTNGSNGGTGFKAWDISLDFGVGGWAGCGIWDSAGAGLMMGQAFGYVGKVGYVNINRSFAQALNTNDSFELDFGVNWDSDIGNKGFVLLSKGVEVVNVNHGGYPGYLTVNGANALTNYGTNTMHWTFTQVAPNQVAVHATGRDGVETFATTVTASAAYGYLDAMHFYSAGLASSAPDQRQSYFNNLVLTEEGTPPPDPATLTFTDGVFAPATTGEYYFAITRSGPVSNDLVLASSNTNAVTVPAGASFAEGTNTLSFNANIVSLVAGEATLVASDTVSGASAAYLVRPVAPTLGISGSAIQISSGPKDYTLLRSTSTGSNVVLSSSNTGVVTVPASTNFGAGQYTISFPATFVGFGTATITASNPASGAWGTFDVAYQAPALFVTGPASLTAGETEIYTVTREGAVGDLVNLGSTVSGVVGIPASVTFASSGDTTVTFVATGLVAGTTSLQAYNDDAMSAQLGVEVIAALPIVAYDEAGNYTVSTFTNGANLGYGFGAWDLWNTLATLGDSTAGGGGNLNSTNGYSFRFMGDGAGGWCNGTRNFASALPVSNVLSFTFTYNWDGGGRGVDIFCATGKFANLIDVSPGNTFKVNGQTLSTEWSPGAVVDVEIKQLALGIQVHLTRATNGVENLNYTTNILNPEPATGVSMYCGGYTASEADNPNYAIYMNNLTIRGVVPATLSFTGGTWNPGATGAYEFVLSRSATVGDEIALSSSNTNSVQVPAGVNFAPGSNTVSFNATVVSLAAGDATLVASNVASGAWAEYTVKPQAPAAGSDIASVSLSGHSLVFTITNGTLTAVYGADTVVSNQYWNFQPLTDGVDYTVSGSVVTLTTSNAARRIIRIGVGP